MARSQKTHNSPLFEELEARLLFSADIGEALAAVAVDQEVEEEQVIVADVESEVEVATAFSWSAEEILAVTENSSPEADVDGDKENSLRKELILINSNVQDSDQLIADLQADQGTQFEVLTLDATKDGLEQLDEILEKRSDLDTLHLISHGAEGRVSVGGTWLDSSALQEASAQISSWGESLTEDGDILLYGCNVASEGGQSFINELAELTGADVAASDDITGHSELGGDWELEAFTGTLESSVVVSKQTQSDWQGFLQSPTGVSGGIEINTDGGNDAYLAAPDANFLTGAPGHTYEVRFSGLTTVESMATFYSHRNPGASQSYLGVQSDGTLDWAGLTSSETYTEVMDGEMHSIAVTWDASTGVISFYVDGEYKESTSVSPQAGGGTGGPTFVLGQHVDYATGTVDPTETFRGVYHDFRVWDHARTAGEIGLNYKLKFDTGSLPTGLLANWQMDGFNGVNEVVDVVGGNNLTIGHASGTGYTTGNVSEELNVDENAIDGSRIGFVVPTAPEEINDIVSDGLFLEGDTDVWQSYTVGQSFGSWTVTAGGGVDHTSQFTSPLGGVGIDLERGVGDIGGTISQTLTTEAGKEYQIVFAARAHASGDPIKNMRVSAGATLQNFTIENSSVYEQYSMTFVASASSTDLHIQGLDSTGFGAIISDVRVFEKPSAIAAILTNDSSLSYDAATGKFYRAVQGDTTWETAKTLANATLLNGVITGQLVTIDSSYENDIVHNLAQGLSTPEDVWIGASDQEVEGEWYWYAEDVEDSTRRFWSGDDRGWAPNNSYTNWKITDGILEPTRDVANQDYAYLSQATGEWRDTESSISTNSYVIEWDAASVLSSFTFSLDDDVGGRFAIDSISGEVTVADSSLLDYEAASSHNIIVKVTDAGGNDFSQAVAIQVNDANETPVNTIPDPPTTTQDVSIIFSSENGNQISIADDAGEDVRVQLSVNNGILAVSGAGGARVAGDGTSSVVIAGTVTEINLALNGLQYDPSSGWQGTDFLTVSSSNQVLYSLNTDSNLQVHYEFNNGSLTSDSSVNGNDSSLIGTPTIFNDSERGDVLSLDGTGEAVEIMSTLSTPSDVTLAAWVKFTEADIWGSEVISIGNDIGLRVNDGGTTGLSGFYWDGSDHQFFTTPVAVDDGQWHHIAYSFNDTGGDSQQLYIDGVLVATETVTDSITYTGWFPKTRIGSHANDVDTQFDFNGRIDDVRIYDKVLSDAEVAEIAGAPVPSSDTDVLTITVNAANNAPVLSGSGFQLTRISEDDTNNSGNLISDIIALGGTDPITDVDPGAVEGIAIYSLTTNNGSWEYDIGSGWTTAGEVGYSDSLLLRDTDRLRFVPNGENGETELAGFMAWDQTTGTAGTKVSTLAYGGTTAFSVSLGSIGIVVDPINDAPIVDLNGTDESGVDFSVTFKENNGAITIIDVDGVLSDVDSTSFQNLSVNVNDFVDGTSEKIIINGYTFSNGVPDNVIQKIGTTDIELDFDGSGFNIARDGSGTMPLADLQTLFASIQYENISDTPTNGDRTVEFTLFDSDNLGSVIATSTITVEATNDVPVVQVDAIAVDFTEQSPVGVDVNLTITDPDTANLVGATVKISSGYENGVDSLNFTAMTGVSGNFDSTTGILTFTGTKTVAEYQTLLRTVSFNNSSDAPSTTSRTIEWVVDDEVGTSAPVTRSINIVTLINDAPVNSFPASPTIAEDTTLSFTGTNKIEISDPDLGSGDLRVQLNLGAGGTLSFGDTTGLSFTAGDGTDDANMVFTGSLADINAALTTLTFSPTENYNGSVNFAIFTNDQGNTGTDPGLSGDASSEQDTDIIAITVTAVNDAGVFGGDTSGTGNEDGGAITGTLTFTDAADGDSAPNFTVTSGAGDGSASINSTTGAWSYTPDANFNGSDSFTVTVTDDDNHTETQVISLTVDPVNDAGTFGGDTSGTGNEDGGAITGTLTFTDAADGDSAPNFTVTSVAGDGSATINSTTGAWSYTPDANFNGSDSFTVSVTDDDNHTETQVITLTVDPVNDAGTFGGDTSGTGNEDGGAITGTLTFTDAADGASAPNFTVTGGAGDGSATINSTTGAWSYTPDANFNGSDSFTVTVTDDDNHTETQVISLTVDPVNDAGTFGGDISGTGNEDGGAITGTLTFTDAADGASAPNFTVTSVAGDGSATINSTTGAWSYTPDANFNGSDSFIVTVTDDDNHTETQVITLTVDPVNDAGTFGGDTSGTGNEDGGAITGTLTFTDSSDGASAPNFTVTGGAGDGSATINSSTGAWSYTPSANYNGSDSFTISVTDDDGSTEIQVVNLILNPVNDSPVIGGISSAEVIEDLDTDQDGILEASGQLTISDPDIGESSFVAGIAEGLYGSLTIDTVGNWQYTTDNTQSAIQELDQSARLTDTLTVNTADGTIHTVVIVISGIDEPTSGNGNDQDSDVIATPVDGGDDTPVIDFGDEQPEPEIPVEEETVEVELTEQALVPVSADEVGDSSGEVTDGNISVEHEGNTVPDSVNTFQPSYSKITQLGNYYRPDRLADLSLQSLNDTEFENFDYTYTPESIAPVFIESDVTFNSVIENKELRNQLDGLFEEMDSSFEQEAKEQQVSVYFTGGVSASIAAGTVSYIFRAGSLMSSFMASVPVWKGFDPVAILTMPKKKKGKSQKDKWESESTSDQKAENMFSEKEE